MYAGTVCDLNGDGRGDLAMITDAITVRLGNGDGTFGPRTDYAGGGRWIEAVDVNRDGHVDLVTCAGTPTTGVVQVEPPSVDCVNFTSIWPAAASQSS